MLSEFSVGTAAAVNRRVVRPVPTPRCWWIVVSEGDSAEMMEKSAAMVFRSALGSPTSAISPVLIAIAIQAVPIVCRSMTFGAFAKMCRFDR